MSTIHIRNICRSEIKRHRHGVHCPLLGGEVGTYDNNELRHSFLIFSHAVEKTSIPFGSIA